RSLSPPLLHRRLPMSPLSSFCSHHPPATTATYTLPLHDALPIFCPRFRPQMSTVRPGVMKKAPFDQAKADACQIVKPAFSLTAEDIKTEVLSVEKAANKLVDLIGADVIVSVGRGISKHVEKGIALAEQLASALVNCVV